MACARHVVPVACGMWHVACGMGMGTGMWHVQACGMWHVQACAGMWHVQACGMWHVQACDVMCDVACGMWHVQACAGMWDGHIHSHGECAATREAERRVAEADGAALKELDRVLEAERSHLSHACAYAYAWSVPV